MKNKILVILFFLIMASVSVLAQENRSFKIYDATSMVDKNGRFLQIVDSDNGRPMNEMGISLDQLTGDVVVYVTFLRWGELLMNDITNNQNQDEVQSFFNFYDHTDGYCLLPNVTNTYNSQAARAIGERLKARFDTEIAEWEKKDDMFTTEELAIIIVKSPGFQELFPLEWIENFEPTNDVGDCPIYYTGKLKIAESVKRFERKVDFEQSAIQVGNELRFNETFNISGPSTKRMVVDRYVEVCTFDEDYNKLADRIAADSVSSSQRALNSVRSKKLIDVIGHLDVNFKKKYRENPYVFPGKKFQMLLKRRMGGDVRRDTLETFRHLTQQAFSIKNIEKDFYEVRVDTVNFRLDYNLFNRYLSKYKTFWAISPLFEKYLPADGGETYDDTASVKKYYNLRTDVVTFERLREYMENGRRLKGSSQNVVEGFVPPIYAIRAQYSPYSEYWISDAFYSQLKLHEDYQHLTGSGNLTYIRRENGGNRLRLKDEKRQMFRNIFQQMSLGRDSLFLSEKPIIDTTVLYWKMPDTDLYYRLRHVNYLHDFMNADTTMTECTCSRTSPLRFLVMGAEPAYPDCPPVINGKYRENYKPRSKADEPQTVDREAHLAFAQGGWNIDMSLGTNKQQLDSLRDFANEILGRTYGTSTAHRIDTITILGISSPEGQYSSNLELAHRRSVSLVNWVKSNCGINRVETVYIDSVASWDDVGNIVGMNGENAQLAYTEGNKDVAAALESLRKVNLKFVYTALLEPNEETILNIYRSGGNGDIYGAYYYYTLLNSDNVTHEEKLKLANDVINHNPNRRFKVTRDVNRANSEHWYDLIRPIAANYIAVDNINNKQWDKSILEPYIDIKQQGNSASYSHGHLVNQEVPKAYKYVNADFVLFNQIQMLIGEGTTSSLQTADSLIQILAVTNYSPEFEQKYHSSRLADLLECYNKQAYLTDRALADRIRSTNIVNFYVINMALAHDAYFNTGKYSDPNVIQYFTECNDSLSVLETLPDDRPEKYYFKAITKARFAEMSLSEDKPEKIKEAREALVDLFMNNESMIGICQGDRYIRDIYRTPDLQQKGIDIYLEAVEEYVRRWSENNR